MLFRLVVVVSVFTLRKRLLAAYVRDVILQDANHAYASGYDGYYDRVYLNGRVLYFCRRAWE